MKLPPLRLHYYGIRLRIIFCILSILLIFFSPYLFKFLRFRLPDVYSVLLFFLLIINFGFGFHEYHTTSQSYLALRNHRRHYFRSSTLLGLSLSVLSMIVAMGFMFFYKGEIHPEFDFGVPFLTTILIPGVVFSTLIFFLFYFLGSLFAIIFHRRWMQLLLLGLLLIFFTLFYQPIWANRHELQLIMIIAPCYFLESLYFYLFIGDILIPTLLIALLNYILYTKKR